MIITKNQVNRAAAKLGAQVAYSGKNRIMYIKHIRHSRDLKNLAVMVLLSLKSTYGEIPIFELKND
jgi:hypothetical protein